MITALILMHLFAGGSLEVFSRSDFRVVGRTIEEPARAEAVAQAMERMNERLVSLFAQRRLSFEQLSEIDHEVDSAEGSYDKILNQLWQARSEARQKYVEYVFIMRENMTRDEWKTAFGNTDK